MSSLILICLVLEDQTSEDKRSLLMFWLKILAASCSGRARSSLHSLPDVAVMGLAAVLGNARHDLHRRLGGQDPALLLAAALSVVDALGELLRAQLAAVLVAPVASAGVVALEADLRAEALPAKQRERESGRAKRAARMR